MKTVNDMISRSEAIEHFRVTDPDGTFAYCSSIIKFLEELPSAEPEQRWIPVSDSPKKDGRYLVTRLDYVTDTKFTDILWYEENTWWNRRAIGDYAVIAWMPLPEPYQVADHE